MTDKPEITLVCCGLIGTLVADDALIERSFAEAIATQGVVSGTSPYARRMAQVHQLRGLAPGDVLLALFPENPARAQAAHLAFDRALADAIRRAEIRALPGVRQALDRLASSGRKLGIITGLSRRTLDMVLEAASWRGTFDVVLCAEDVERALPAPDLALTALLRTGTGDVRQVAVVHGTGAGIEAGRRAGAGLVAGVLTGPHSAARLRAAGATHVLRSMADLPDVLTPSEQEPDKEEGDEVPASTQPAPPRSAGGGTAPRTPGLAAAPPASISIPPQLPLERRTSGR